MGFLEIVGLVILSIFTIGMAVGWAARNKTLRPVVHKFRLKFNIGPIEQKTKEDYSFLSQNRRKKYGSGTNIRPKS